MPVVFTFTVVSAAPQPPGVGSVSNFRRVGPDFVKALPQELQEVPTTVSVDSYKQRTALDGVEYEIWVQWNERVGVWFFSLYYTDGTPIIEGKALVLYQDLLLTVVDPRRPPGSLVLLPIEDTYLEPKKEEVGPQYVFTYQKGVI